jgi:hypothetical protein
MVQHTVAGKLPYQNNLSTRSPSIGPCGANREMHMAARNFRWAQLAANHNALT